MKKYIISIFAVLLGIFMTSSAIASTNIIIVPNTVNITVGQRVDLTVYANPNGAKNGTVKVELSYPADLLEVSSFKQSPTWMSNTEAGYDSIDNINGTIIKTAGYPRGFTSAVSFGDISFTAKRAGVATVTVTNGSFALDVSGKNVSSGNSQSVINITTTTPTPVVVTGGLTGQEATIVGALEGISSTTSTTTDSNDSKLTASAFGSMMNANLWYIIGGLILLAIILWILFWLEKRRKEKEEKKLNK